MELNQLLQFKTIAECATMTDAADRLHISQPALSIMLKKLEDELGVRLFDRKRNKIIINEAGELALSHTTVILEKIEAMKLSLQDYAQRDFIFKVGFCDPGPLWYCTPSFAMTHRDYEMKSSLYAENANEIDLLLNNHYDVLIVDQELTHPDIICKPFLKDAILLSVPNTHPLATKKSISFSEIDHLSLTMFYVGGSFFAKQQKLYDAFSSTISLELMTDFFIFQKNEKKTHAPTITTQLVKHYRDDGPNRKLIPITDPGATIHYYLAYLKKNTTRLKTLLDWADIQKSL